MDIAKSYCEAVEQLDMNNLHRIYHDTAYGFPIDDDDELFGRLILEINQAGLSWTTILKKQENFRKAFHNFNIAKVCSVIPALSGTGLKLTRRFITPM
jgi:DNA-3-methyladenine glycosylase I